MKTIEVLKNDGYRTTVQARTNLASPGLAAHRSLDSGSDWSITHVASGVAVIVTLADKATALKALATLGRASVNWLADKRAIETWPGIIRIVRAVRDTGRLPDEKKQLTLFAA